MAYASDNRREKMQVKTTGMPVHPAQCKRHTKRSTFYAPCLKAKRAQLLLSSVAAYEDVAAWRISANRSITAVAGHGAVGRTASVSSGVSCPAVPATAAASPLGVRDRHSSQGAVVGRVTCTQHLQVRETPRVAEGMGFTHGGGWGDSWRYIHLGVWSWNKNKTKGKREKERKKKNISGFYHSLSLFINYLQHSCTVCTQERHPPPSPRYPFQRDFALFRVISLHRQPCAKTRLSTSASGRRRQGSHSPIL